MNDNNKFMISHLAKPVPPWILKLSREKLNPSQTERALAEDGITARVLNGDRMRTTDELFSEFSSRLDFPDYFGRNWDALDESLADLSWLPGLAYALVVEEASHLLEDEQESQDEVLFRLVEGVAEEWAAPVNLGEFWDRPAIPFHLVLHETPNRLPALVSRLEQAGIEAPTLIWDDAAIPTPSERGKPFRE